MLKEIKFMLSEMRKLQALEDAFPEVTNDPKANFDELVRYSKETNSGVEIEGHARLFKIITKPDILTVIFWASLVLYILFSSLFTNSLDEAILITLFVSLAAMLVYFRFGSTTYNITVDSHQKLLVLKSNNLFGRFIKPEIIIEFREFTDFTCKSIYANLKGFNFYYYKVTIHYLEKKQAFLYLPDGRKDSSVQKLFVSHLRSIIRNAV